MTTTQPPSKSSENNQRDEHRRNGSAWGIVGTILAVIAILLAIFLRGCSLAVSDPIATCTPIPGPPGAAGIAGASAYDVWIALGHTGTEEEFLRSLVGKPGKNGFSGTDGLTPATGSAGDDGAPGSPGSDGDAGDSAYQLWLDAGNTGSKQDFLDSLIGAAGADGVEGETGETGAQGLSAYELWLLEGNDGDVAAFLADLEGDVGPQGIQGLQGLQGEPGICTVGETGATGPQGDPGPQGSPGPAGPQGELGPIGPPGETGSQGEKGDTGARGDKGERGEPGPAGTSGLGDSGSFWDTTIQGFDGLVSTTVDAAHPMYFSDADTANNVGVTIERCAGDEAKPAGYPVTPKSCITFTHAGVYNIAFSAQLWRTQGGDESVVSIWLRKDGSNVPLTNTDVTLKSNQEKRVAAWNFFAPVTCGGSCSTYQIMWSYSKEYANLWYQSAQTNPTRPEIPSVILTVNQVK